MKKNLINMILLSVAALSLASCNSNVSTTTTTATETISEGEITNSSSEDTTSESSISREESSTSTTTTTIPASSTDDSPKGYYSNVDTSLRDADFRKSLSKTINLGFIHKTYDEAYDIIAESDEDPNNKSNCICLYTGESIKKNDHTSSTGYNREHVWAKSHGFKDEKTSNPYCDTHHLRVTGMVINSTRGNSDFYEFGENEAFKVSGENKYTSELFEPRDEVKGDVARIMFYMATMYGFDGKYNLTLTDDKVTSGSTGNGRFGNLETLVKWSLEDPVSEAEVYRNDVVFSYQNNRNPYIDHPEYVYLAYPEYAAKYDNTTTVDENKVSNVINTINNLPDSITLENKDAVNVCKELYDSLNYKEKALVTNYSKLESALKTIASLEGTEGNSDNNDDNTDTPAITNGVSIDLTKGNYGSSFTEQNFEIDGYKLHATVGAIDDQKEGIKLGVNSKNRSKYSTTLGDSTYISALSMTANVENSKSVTYYISHVWDNLDYAILFTVDGVTYETLTTGSLTGDVRKVDNSTTLSASLSTPTTGRFIIAIKNSEKGCRLSISQFVISNK